FVERRVGVLLHRLQRFLQLALAFAFRERLFDLSERRRLMRLDFDDVVSVLRANGTDDLAGLGRKRGLLELLDHLTARERAEVAATAAGALVVRLGLGQ